MSKFDISTGITPGAAVGKAVGGAGVVATAVGAEVGNGVGAGPGPSPMVGAVVGEVVGSGVAGAGPEVGTEVGAGVGAGPGPSPGVGAVVGRVVGDVVGAGVGACATASRDALNAPIASGTLSTTGATQADSRRSLRVTPEESSSVRESSAGALNFARNASSSAMSSFFVLPESPMMRHLWTHCVYVNSRHRA
jgi:hypothetical protein